MKEGSNELWVNAICAVVKSDLKIHDEEIEGLRNQLKSKHEIYMDLGIETATLFNEILFKLQDTSVGAEEHFQNVKKVLLNFKIHEQKKSLSVLLQLCNSIAYKVNRFNKKELIMLSRLEEEFKKF